jgi:hypothetical protein
MIENNEVVLSPAEEAAQRTERQARLKKMEQDEREERQRRIEASAATTRGFNEAYFRKQEELAQQIAKQNAKNAAAQKEREKSVNERRAAEAKARIEELHGKTNKPPEGWLDTAGTIPAPRNPSITLQPLPEKYPAGDPRRDMSEDLIIRMGMNPDPTQPA